MGFNNPRVPWRDLEAQLSDRTVTGPSRSTAAPATRSAPRCAGAAPAQLRRSPTTAYAELHCHSGFSFLDGASQPEQLVEEAARLGLEALALTDHDGFYGVVRFAEAAREVGLPTVFGAELSLAARGAPSAGVADPEGPHLLVLARNPSGYAKLSSTLSDGHLGPPGSRAGKGRPDYGHVDFSAVHGDDWLVLTGCRKGAVARALLDEGPRAAARELAALVDMFGRDNVAVELWDHGQPLDTARNDALAELAVHQGLAVVATNNVHYATPRAHRLAGALAAVRAGRSLADLEGWLPAGATAHLRSGDEQARRFARWPGAVEAAAELGRACAFDLSLVAPRLPPYPCPEGLDEMAFLARLVEERAPRRYGAREAERAEGAWAQLDRELEVIEQLGYPGYFLVIWDIVEFCRREGIYCQGRGSAANSAVCYVLGITNVDAVRLELLFERFLSVERDGPPDIDLDIESGRREEVIQYVYRRHGRRHAAQVANVVTYRARSAVRDMAKALGHSPAQQDTFARSVGPWGRLSSPHEAAEVPEDVRELARQAEDTPRHLGIHSGGMVICDGPVVDVCPVEWARKPERSVLQWDKDDCAAVGLVKFDLLGLGMLSALHNTIDLIGEVHGVEVDLAALPHDDPEVYDMLCRADAVGVFQVESRAQMATLPRLQPRSFYDLVVEVALIRPGPIQGGSVHPYIRRRKGQEPVSYQHPLLEPSLRKTLGVPLFQEQLMQMAMDVAGFSAAEADRLRQAIGSKRSSRRMAALEQRFREGAEERGVDEPVAAQIWEKLTAFANYGFPESHSVSFAYLVYASSWLKRYYPAAFCAGLLNAQPMGFYAPHSLVQDARRHGVEVATPDVNVSGAAATLELAAAAEAGVAPAGTSPEAWGIPGPTVRLGLGSVRSVGASAAEQVVAERMRAGPFSSLEDLARRVPEVTVAQLEALATAGAFASVGLGRREALWVAGAVAAPAGTARFSPRLAGVVAGAEPPTLPGMSAAAMSRADLWATGVSPEGHPTRFVRSQLDALGVVPAARLLGLGNGVKVGVGGVVTHRQRPATAGGTTFVNLEDESGFINVVVSQGCWEHHRRVLSEVPAVVVWGRLERVDEAVSVVAERVEPLAVHATAASRDFR